MMEMLYDSISDCKVRTSVRQEIVNRQRCAAKALDVCCFQMKELLENMGLPKDAYCAGWKTDRSDAHVYEFVSYRPENGNEKPFILEDICKQSSDPTRFKAVSYENLKKAFSLMQQRQRVMLKTRRSSLRRQECTICLTTCVNQALI